MTIFHKNRGVTIETINKSTKYSLVEEHFTQTNQIIGQCIKGSTIFTYADSAEELESFRLISGKSYYVGREGVEFYPQELFLLQATDRKADKNSVYLKNFQNDRSKYKIPEQTLLLEKKYLHPLIKGINIERYHVSDDPSFVVPFPYEAEHSMRVPIPLKTLRSNSPLLAKYFLNFQKIIESQTEYNDRIIGKQEKEFYSLARVGEYSFAENYVAFRDNTKWQAAVISNVSNM